MMQKFQHWNPLSLEMPQKLEQLSQLILENRRFTPVATLDYGDHGLHDALETVIRAIRGNKRIVLYADYDVDGTMSCVSWIWFFRAIGYKNFCHYIPDRFKEGYGLNLTAIKNLIDDNGAELIITMDTGITANEEAALCKSRGVDFLCTDHHKVQPERMPDCVILNPKFHPHPDYQELCGCGVTFVLLRQLAKEFHVPHHIWVDLLALTGMATICDVVPLNGVNHKLARLGVEALAKSRRPVLRSLLEAASVDDSADEKDVGFRLGPRINAVGRLEHADAVIKAFVDEDPSDLVVRMGECNERRKQIQRKIIDEAHTQAKQFADQPIIFIGGDWHQGVVGIAASKIAEEFWRPTWLFQKSNGVCKGSARSIPGFDVTEAMSSCGHLFTKFGGHRAAGGYAFPEDVEDEIRNQLVAYAQEIRQSYPARWESSVSFDCKVDSKSLNLDFLAMLDELKPFGHGFSEPQFVIEAGVADVTIYRDKKTQAPRHTAVTIAPPNDERRRVMFFNRVLNEVKIGSKVELIVTASRDRYRGYTRVSLYGVDIREL